MAEYFAKEALIVKIRTEKAEWEKQPVPIDIFEKFNHRVVPKLLQNVIDFLEAQPTTDVAPVVHGEWIMRGGKRYCSVCEKRAAVTRDSEDFWYTVGTDFCPNCGADMRPYISEDI